VGARASAAEHLAIEQKVTVEQAMLTVKQSDRDRAELFRRVYHMDWMDAGVYDLCVNTDTVPHDVAAQTVVASVKD
jgi:cytidylate kinase